VHEKTILFHSLAPAILLSGFQIPLRDLPALKVTGARWNPASSNTLLLKAA
jgi:hypothetical protein